MSLRSTTIFLQEACLKHQFIRSKDTSTVVERTERLRALNIGIASLCARLEALKQDRHHSTQSNPPQATHDSVADDLVSALENLNIGTLDQYGSSVFPIQVCRSQVTLNLLNHAAVKYVHGDIEQDVYLESLIKWTQESREKISSEGTEIPAGLSQGDLYRECGSFVGEHDTHSLRSQCARHQLPRFKVLWQQSAKR